MQKEGSSKELFSQQHNDDQLHKSRDNFKSAFELNINKNRNMGKLFKNYILIFIVKKEEVDKSNDNMSKSLKDLMEYFSKTDLSMIEECIDPDNESKYHEFKEGISKY